MTPVWFAAYRRSMSGEVTSAAAAGVDGPVGHGRTADDAAPALDDRDRAVLDFERQWWKYAGAKESAVRDLFGMSATRYYQVLNALIDTEAALAYDPMLVKRLRRMRAVRQRDRSTRRLAGS